MCLPKGCSLNRNPLRLRRRHTAAHRLQRVGTEFRPLHYSLNAASRVASGGVLWLHAAPAVHMCSWAVTCCLSYAVPPATCCHMPRQCFIWSSFTCSFHGGYMLFQTPQHRFIWSSFTCSSPVTCCALAATCSATLHMEQYETDSVHYGTGRFHIDW